MNDNIHDRTYYSYNMNKLFYCPINNMWVYPYMCSCYRNIPSYDYMEDFTENNYNRLEKDNITSTQYKDNEKKQRLSNMEQELEDIIVINEQRENITIKEDKEKHKNEKIEKEEKEVIGKQENIQEQEAKDNNKNKKLLEKNTRELKNKKGLENTNLTNNIVNIRMIKVPLKEITD